MKYRWAFFLCRVFRLKTVNDRHMDELRAKVAHFKLEPIYNRCGFVTGHIRVDLPKTSRRVSYEKNSVSV
jgi:hypothetical protein